MADLPQSFGPGWDGDIIRSHLSDRVDELAEKFKRTAAAINAQCQSEIERRLAHHLAFRDWEDLTFRMRREIKGANALADLRSHADLTIIHDLDLASAGAVVMGFQVHIGPYRADMALSCHSVFEEIRPFTVVIECDGHDFHERTKEQAAHDKARDRYMQCQGLTVLRFTGSEIFRRGDALALEVWSYVQRRMANPFVQEVA